MKLVVFVLTMAPLAAADLAGTWNLTAHTPNRDIKLDLVLKQVEGKWSGSLSSERGSVDLEEITVSGDELHSKFTAGAASYSLKLTVTGDSLKGSASSSDGVTVNVDGVRAGAAAPHVFTGKWKMKAVKGEREYDVELEITETGGALGGQIRTGDGAVLPLREVKAGGGKLEFKVAVDPDVYTISFEIGETGMKGTYKAADGTSGTVTASR